MRDELETFENELKRTAPKPKPAVRKQTLSKAMEAFDRHHQGLSVQPRQTGQEVNVMSWLKNRIHPLQPRVSGGCLCPVPGGCRGRRHLLAPRFVHRTGGNQSGCQAATRTFGGPCRRRVPQAPRRNCPGRGRHSSACSGVRTGAAGKAGRPIRQGGDPGPGCRR